MLSYFLLGLVTVIGRVWGRIHYIPHSHMDMGWVQTINDYFETSVRPIHDNVVEVLRRTPRDLPYRLRPKFVLNDLYFLRMWLTEDPAKTGFKTRMIRDLIKEGLLEIVGTGMVMADTACPHYEDLITNYFAGIAFTETNFTTRSQVAFQLDSFGQTHALFFIGSLFGLHDAVFHRIPHFLRDQLKSHGLFELQWLLPFGRRVNVHINENYGWDRNFSFVSANSTPAINVTHWNSFKADRKKGYQKSKMVLLGDDFEYSNAAAQFSMFEEIGLRDPSFTFSTMAEYLDDFYAKDTRFIQLSGDFMPYIDPYKEGDTKGYQAWTGYFTAKPNLKHRVRRVNQMHRALMVWATSWMARNHTSLELVRRVHSELLELSADVSILMHHDCITGTAKREADTDYYDRIRQMEEKATRVFDLLTGRESYQCDADARFVGSVDCFWLRELIKASTKMEMTIINPSASLRTERIRLSLPYDSVRHFAVIYVTMKDSLKGQALCFDERSDCLFEFDMPLPGFDKWVHVYLYSQNENRIFEILSRRTRPTWTRPA